MTSHHEELFATNSPLHVFEEGRPNRPTVTPVSVGREPHSGGSPRPSCANIVIYPYPDRFEIYYRGAVQPTRRPRRRYRIYLLAALYGFVLSGLLGMNLIQAGLFVGLCEFATVAWVQR